jgi:alpha-beta hydrolase superfamily lysophospholipase
MARHGAALAARGMMVAVPELPGHGERAVPGRAFLDLLDPAGLALGVRQTVVDVLGAVRAVRCGLTLPDGRRLAPRDVRFFGYSLGAMVGVIARTLEPDLGPTVLVAPGGDIAGWLMMQVGAQLGFQLVTCIGGPESGASCAGRKECAPPGTCHADPMLLELAETLHFPYALAAAPGDPLSFAAERAPETSRAPLLLVTGGTDFVLHPLLATRLADAYGLRSVGPHLRRGPRATLVQWPDLGHDLLESAAVREQVYRFLASGGRRVVRPATPLVARGDGG